MGPHKFPLFERSGSMQGDSVYTRLRFVNFQSATKTCGAQQAAITPFLQPDYTPY